MGFVAIFFVRIRSIGRLVFVFGLVLSGIKLVHLFDDIYPIFASKPRPRRGHRPKWQARSRIVESKDTFFLTWLTLDQGARHIALPGKLVVAGYLGGIRMGASSNLKPQLSVSAFAFPIEKSRPNLETLPPRRFLRVPTHAVSIVPDRRRSPRAYLSLPLQLTKIGDRAEAIPVTLVTKNISSSGIYFLAPRVIEPGTGIELEVSLIERPLGRGSVRLKTAAHVVRIEVCEVPGWNGYAASFDDIDFRRDDEIPHNSAS